MRPGAFSKGGFLGPSESLEAVISRDDQTLEGLGIGHAQIAEALREVLQAALSQRDDLLHSDYAEYRKRETHIPDLYHPGTVPRFSLSNLPGTDIGYMATMDLQVFLAGYRGLQECPWGCEYDRWSSFDFQILNRQTGESVTGPGLIVHLIRQHHFFEGVESPYRTDPQQLVRVLHIRGEEREESSAPDTGR